MQPADEPEMALEAADDDGFLAVPNLSDAAEWDEAIDQYRTRRHAKGRAAIVVVVDLEGSATIDYAPPATPSYAGRRLKAVAARLGERHHGSCDFAFEEWISGRLDGDLAECLASNLWRLDRFARNRLGAVEFEKGPIAARRWEVVDGIMDMDPHSSSF